MKRKIEQGFEVRDARGSGRFWMDNEILKVYGSQLGPAGIAIYCALCLHADNTRQDCYPSRETISAETGVSPRAVTTSLHQLRDLGLIHIEARQGYANVYTLLSVPKQPVQDMQEDKETPAPRAIPPLHHVQETPAPRADKLNSETKLIELNSGIASDANAPTPPPPDTPQPSKPKRTRTQTSAPAQVENVPPPSPPATPEQAAANDAAFDALEAAPPEARQPSRATGTSKDALERAIGDVCFRGDKDLRRANMGVIRAVGKDIRALNADLETPITAELIYFVFEDSGYWQRHFMSLDETTNTRRLPTPGIVGKHTLNILAWGKGQTQVQTGEDAIRQAMALNERVLGDAPDLTRPPTTTRRLTRPPVMSLVRPLSQTA